MRYFVRKLILLFCLLAPFLSINLNAKEILTEFQADGHKKYSSLEGLNLHLTNLQKMYPHLIKVSSFGKSQEGKSLPYAIISDPLVENAEEAKKLNRPIVVIGANIHGDEKTMREASLIFMAKLLSQAGKKESILREVILLFAPTLNPDGAEPKEDKPNGQRKNANQVDLNRDFVKLEQPETSLFVSRILNKWKPHMWIDGHNGGAYPYNILYLAPTHPNVPKFLSDFSNKKLFPAIDKSIKKMGGLSFFYARGGKNQTWKVGGHLARIGRNYGGLMNMLTILIESPNKQELKAAVNYGVVTLETIIQFVRDNKREVLSLVEKSKRLILKGKRRKYASLEAKYYPSRKRVSFIYSPSKDDDGNRIPRNKREKILVKRGRILNKARSIKKRRLPKYYILNSKVPAVEKLLDFHGIEYEKVIKPFEARVQVFKMKSFEFKEEYDHPKTLMIEYSSPLRKKMKVISGAIKIKTKQFGGRVIGQLFEPGSPDGIITWNFLDSLIFEGGNFKKGEILPLYKTNAAKLGHKN